MDDGEEQPGVTSWVAEIPPRRWWRVGLALGLLTAAAAALLIDTALAWVARWPRCDSDATRR